MTGAEQLVEKPSHGQDPSGTVLTGRNGRAAMLDLTRRALAGIRTGKMVAVVAAELDHFDDLVVASGDATGQIIRGEMARRLIDRLGTARSGVCMEGDRYLVMTELAATPDSVQGYLEKVQHCFDEPVVVASATYYVSAGIGITFSTLKTDDARLLLGTAEVACTRARRTGANTPVVFDHDARSQIHADFQQGQALHESIARNELLLRYQPIIDLQQRKPTGLSTDFAWQPLNGDLTSDRELFGCAEKHGLLVPLSEWLLREFITQWTAAASSLMKASPSVTIRVTSEQLSSWLVRSSDQLSRARTAVPGRLSVEIVEGHDGRGIYEEEALEWLHRLGVGAVLDDIGDRSLLTSLRAGSVDALRLHAELVDRVHLDGHERDLIAKLIDLAHEFGIVTIADGVRDQAQIEALTELGCDHVRSYFTSGSLPLADATAFLTDVAPAS